MEDSYLSSYVLGEPLAYGGIDHDDDDDDDDDGDGIPQHIQPEVWSKLMNSAALTSFLPKKLRKSLSGQGYSTSKIRAETFKGAVLFVDISGFTILNERLKKENAETAADRMCQILNSFFQPVIATIYKNGGDVFKFSGDAVTVVFIENGKEFPDLQSVARQATFCSEAIHDCASGSKHGLALHMAIGVGQLTGVQVGGKNNRMEYILAGTPMDQISIAEGLAAKQETAISPHTWEYLKDLGSECTTTLVSELDDDYYETMPVKSKPCSPTYEEDMKTERRDRKALHREILNDGYRMLDRDQFQQWRKEQAEKPEPTSDGLFELMSNQTYNEHTVEAVSELVPIVDAMKSFIPGAVVSRLADGQDGLDLADTLKLSCIFVCIEGLDLAASDDSHSELDRVKSLAQRLMLKIQESVYSCEGSINKILVDDKGLLCVCALGLPPTYHGDDPQRAVKCAGYLLKNIKSLAEQPKVKIGVTTGTNVFCGVVGSQVRREYTVMGPVVNLSARLMSNSEWGSMMVCETTKKATASDFKYKDPVTRLLKGIGDTQIYEPVFDKDGRIRPPDKQKTKTKFGFDKILASIKHGRDDKLSELHTMLRKCKEKRSGTILLMGDRGSGKGFLADKLPIIAQAYGYIPLNSKGKSKVARSDAMSYEEYQKFKKLYEPLKDDQQMMAQREAGNGDLFQPLNGWTMFSAWHEILETCITRASEKKGISKPQWLDDTLANYEEDGRNPLYGEAFNLRDILPPGYVTEDVTGRRQSGFSDFSMMDPLGESGGYPGGGYGHFDMAGDVNLGDSYAASFFQKAASRPPIPVTKVDKVREILIAVLNTFAKEMGQPVLVIIQLKRATDIFTGIDENWELLYKLGNLEQNVIVCAVTRNLQKFDANAQHTDQNKEKIVAGLIKKATKDDTKIDLDSFDAERRIKFVADVLSHEDMQLDNKAGEPYIIHPLDLKKLPALAKILSDVAAGNPKYIIEFLGAMLTGYNETHQYHSGPTNTKELYESDWTKPAVAITGNSCIEVLCRDISHYPPPTKIVGYVWQQYETLTVHQQYLLKCASCFEFGFTMDMLDGMVKDKSDYRKDEAGMVRLSKDVFGLKQEAILDMKLNDDMGMDVAGVSLDYAKDSGLMLLNILRIDGQPIYKFRTKLLQRLITERFTTKDKAEMQLRKRKAFAKCRWRRVRAFIRKLMQSKKEFELIGFTILDKKKFEDITVELIRRNKYLKLVDDNEGIHPGIDVVRQTLDAVDPNDPTTQLTPQPSDDSNAFGMDGFSSAHANLEKDRLISRLKFDSVTQAAMVLTKKVRISRLQRENTRIEEQCKKAEKRLAWFEEQQDERERGLDNTSQQSPTKVAKELADQDQKIRSLQNSLAQARSDCKNYLQLAVHHERRASIRGKKLSGMRSSLDAGVSVDHDPSAVNVSVLPLSAPSTPKITLRRTPLPPIMSDTDLDNTAVDYTPDHTDTDANAPATISVEDNASIEPETTVATTMTTSATTNDITTTEDPMPWNYTTNIITAVVVGALSFVLGAHLNK